MSDKYVPELGKVIEGVAFRDAVHVAVAPVETTERIKPGSHVCMVSPGKVAYCHHAAPAAIGVIDPYLTDIVEQGQKVWLFLYPNTITGLRHVWTHPAFKITPPKESSDE